MSRIKYKIRQHAGTVLLCVLSALFMWLGFANAQNLKKTYPALSLRYSQALPPNAANEARAFIRKNPQQWQVWPTYWSAEKIKLKTEYNEAEVNALYYDGDPALVWSAKLIEGIYPGELDDAGIAVSAGLAQALWGSSDVIGQQIWQAGKQYTVRGVFEGKQPLALVASFYKEPDGGWKNIELLPPLKENATEYANKFATKSGLGTPDYIVNGKAVASIVSAVAYLPLIVAGVFLLSVLYKKMARLYKWEKSIIVWGAFLLAALALPFLLAKLPAWLIPPKWSDFSFWGKTFVDIGGKVVEWLSLPPSQKDVLAKLMIIGQAIAVPLACLFGTLTAIKLTKTVNPKEDKQELKSNKTQKPLNIEETIKLN